MSTSPIRSGVPTLLLSPDLRPVIDALPPCIAAGSGHCATNCLACRHTVRLRQTTRRQKGGLRREAVPYRPTRGLPDRLTCGRVASGPPASGMSWLKGRLTDEQTRTD